MTHATHDHDPHGPTRRSLLAAGATGCAVAGALAHGAAWTLSLAPRVSYEPPSVRRLGPPKTFPEGVTFLSAEKVFVVRKEAAFRGLSAVCTHLGCTVDRTDAGFRCPCHGSEFDAEGVRTGGPAPRGLVWRAMSLAADGTLLVDLAGEVAATVALTVPEESLR
ncbi:MAG: Rieske 2Fe-2S domain-containing protein [Planctomycetes bacterium]|nr:Rieske 2Fe-2S domain-containing protein [Planctomycetota bacterium]